MVDDASPSSSSADDGIDGERPDGAPGIAWEPGEEDYPFAARPGESALKYFERWLEEATYARVEHAGQRYVHEVDVMNVVNHITADVGLLRGRLDEYGDQVVTAADYAAIIERIEGAIALLRDARTDLDHGPVAQPELQGNPR
jgi:hypothetical protein